MSVENRQGIIVILATPLPLPFKGKQYRTDKVAATFPIRGADL